jgi:hypothetical protein
MGFMKHEMERISALKGTALSVLVKAGTLKECELHEGYFWEGSGNLVAAYKLANYMITKGEIDVDDRREFSDIIKKTYEEWWALDDCAYCDHVLSKD